MLAVLRALKLRPTAFALIVPFEISLPAQCLAFAVVKWGEYSALEVVYAVAQVSCTGNVLPRCSSLVGLTFLSFNGITTRSTSDRSRLLHYIRLEYRRYAMHPVRIERKEKLEPPPRLRRSPSTHRIPIVQASGYQHPNASPTTSNNRSVPS